MYKLSIIIPCYNVENYVERCLDSIVNQTVGLDQVQIIAVDDASTDQTLNKLKRYEEQYSENIAIIPFEENRGQAYARNVALQYALGEYVLYVDSDDWIELNTVERLFEVVEKNPIDMVMFYNDNPSYENEALNIRLGEDSYVRFTSIDDRKKVLMSNRLRVMACGRMIRREFMIENNISFPEGYKFEDCYWTVMLFLAMKDLYIINETLYHYFRNPNSTVNAGKDDMDRLYVALILMEDVKKRGYYDLYKDELEFYFYEKFFVDTIFPMYRFGQISIEMIEVIKRELLIKCDIKNNKYYIERCDIPYSIIEGVLRRILVEKVDNRLVLEVGNELIQALQ